MASKRRKKANELVCCLEMFRIRSERRRYLSIDLFTYFYAGSFIQPNDEMKVKHKQEQDGRTNLARLGS
jgi:hypothetical protein